MKSTPSTDSISWMVMMCGWLRAEAALASCKNCQRWVSLAVRFAGRTLIATSRSSMRVQGAIDLAHAAGSQRRQIHTDRGE